MSLTNYHQSCHQRQLEVGLSFALPPIFPAFMALIMYSNLSESTAARMNSSKVLKHEAKKKTETMQKKKRKGKGKKKERGIRVEVNSRNAERRVCYESYKGILVFEIFFHLITSRLTSRKVVQLIQRDCTRSSIRLCCLIYPQPLSNTLNQKDFSTSTQSP